MLLREDFIASCGDNRNFIHDETCDSVRSFVVTVAGFMNDKYWGKYWGKRQLQPTHHNMYYVNNLVLLFIYFHFLRKQPKTC